MKRICAALLGGALLLGVSPALCAENPEGAKLAVSTDAKPGRRRSSGWTSAIRSRSWSAT